MVRLDPEVAAAAEHLRRKRRIGLGEAVNELARGPGPDTEARALPAADGRRRTEGRRHRCRRDPRAARSVRRRGHPVVLDANVLLHAVDSTSHFHATARAWLENAMDG